MTALFDQASQLEGLDVRFSEPADADVFAQWLADPHVRRDFPMGEPKEVQEATRRWIEFYKQEAALTAVYRGAPVGVSVLFLQHYERIKHQAMHILFVATEYRNLGIGSALLEDTIHLARVRHHIELLHIELYGSKEAERFYKKRGFIPFARQARWTKEEGEYLPRVCLERFL